MKIAILNMEGEIIDNNTGKSSLLLKNIANSALTTKNMASVLGDEFFYLKLDGKEKAIVGIEEEKVVILFPESEAEEVEAVERFKS